VASGLDDTASIIANYERMVIADLERFSGVALQDHLVVKKSFTQSGFSKRFNAIHGTALGLSHTLLQSAWWRPKLKSPTVDGLYYTGAYTHPGVGMPTCVLSGEIAATLVAKDYA
jgi:phytoene desaturase